MDKPTPSPYATLIYSKTSQLEINRMGFYFSLMIKINQKAAHVVKKLWQVLVISGDF